MAVVRTESRCRIGITWYDSEEEAQKAAAFYERPEYRQAVADANIGFAQVGRAPSHDRPGEYAVITP